MTEGIRLEKNEPQVQIPVLSKEEHVWLQAWINVSRSDNCTRSFTAANWADDCLTAFKARFGKN